MTFYYIENLWRKKLHTCLNKNPSLIKYDIGTPCFFHTLKTDCLDINKIWILQFSPHSKNSPSQCKIWEFQFSPHSKNWPSWYNSRSGYTTVLHHQRTYHLDTSKIQISKFHHHLRSGCLDISKKKLDINHHHAAPIWSVHSIYKSYVYNGILTISI